jgi:hypothetical protein
VEHSFNDSADPTKGGTWYDDYGRCICTWEWDADTKTVTVVQDVRGKRMDLSEQFLTPEELREILPQLALETAQKLAFEG